MKYEVTVIIPAYNENGTIKNTVESTRRMLQGITSSGEIIIAEDGSKDGTREAAEEIARTSLNIRFLSSKERLGRGRALSRAIKEAEGEVICYIDADLATDMSHLAQLIDAIRYEDYDFVTGSRLLPSSDVVRSMTRSLASRGYNTMVRLLLGSKLYDHQCGFKAFKRTSIMRILDSVKDRHWFWDTELLVRGQREGYKIKEIPVKWQQADNTKVRVLNDVFGMGSQLIRLWWDLN